MQLDDNNEPNQIVNKYNIVCATHINMYEILYKKMSVDSYTIMIVHVIIICSAPLFIPVVFRSYFRIVKSTVKCSNKKMCVLFQNMRGCWENNMKKGKTKIWKFYLMTNNQLSPRRKEKLV